MDTTEPLEKWAPRKSITPPENLGEVEIKQPSGELGEAEEDCTAGELGIAEGNWSGLICGVSG